MPSFQLSHICVFLFPQAGECIPSKMLSRFLRGFETREKRDEKHRLYSAEDWLETGKKNAMIALSKEQAERGSENDPPAVPFVRPRIKSGGTIDLPEDRLYGEVEPGTVRDHCFFHCVSTHLCIDPETPKPFQTLYDSVMHFANIGALTIPSDVRDVNGPMDLMDHVAGFVGDMSDEEFNHLLDKSKSFLKGFVNRIEYESLVAHLGISKECPNDVLFDIIILTIWLHLHCNFEGKVWCYLEASGNLIRVGECGTMMIANEEDIKPFGATAGPQDVVFFYSQHGSVMPAYCYPWTLHPMRSQDVNFFMRECRTKAMYYDPRMQSMDRHFYYCIYYLLTVRGHPTRSFLHFIQDVQAHIMTLDEQRIEGMQPFPHNLTKQQIIHDFDNFTSYRSISSMDEDIVASFLSTVCGGLRLVVRDHFLNEFDAWTYVNACHAYNASQIEEESLSSFGSMNSLDVVVIKTTCLSEPVQYKYMPGFYMPWNIQHIEI